MKKENKMKKAIQPPVEPLVTPSITPGKATVTEADVNALQKKIQDASSEINSVLVKYQIEFIVVHKMSVNSDLKQEEIVHEIVLRPRK